MDRGITTLLELGYEKTSDVIYDSYREIDICFLEKNGYVIELVSPKNKQSVVYNLIKKIGNTPYHICYLCEDIFEAEEELRKKGFVQYEDAHEAIAFGGCKVSFMISPFVGMIELLEENV
jgi:methylmalonyl-CoA/ethylmalonyl-CoA epimerase